MGRDGDSRGQGRQQRRADSTGISWAGTAATSGQADWDPTPTDITPSNKCSNQLKRFAKASHLAASVAGGGERNRAGAAGRQGDRLRASRHKSHRRKVDSWTA